jgi:hypothetical protein
MKSNDVVTALDVAGQIADIARTAKSGSLIEYTRATRVEPSVLLDLRAAQLPYIEDVLNNGLNMFAGYYLQAVSIAVNVGSVNVIKTLDKLNPNRDPLSSLSLRSMESYKHGLPFPGQPSLEAFGDNVRDTHDEIYGEKGNEGISTRDAMKQFNESTNLSVGKLIDVNIESEGQKATIPVSLRLRVSTIRPDIMTHTLSLDSKQVGKKERFHQWRSGQIEFWNDLVLAQDLIKKHRKNLMNDESGYYKTRTTSKRRNTLSALVSGEISVATASSIFVLTTETAKELERQIRGRLKDFKVREKLFSETYAMMMFIVDPDWEQVTIYHHSIDEPTEASIREIQRSNKSKGGTDIAEILNAFRQSKSPTI